MYLPGPWLKTGANEIVVLDLTGPEKPSIRGLKAPVLDVLRPEKDFYSTNSRKMLQLTARTRVQEGTFAAGAAVQEIKFAQPATGRQFCLESVDAFDGKAYAAAAEIQLLDEAGATLNQSKWTIAYADSEEDQALSGSAVNAINGQAADAWHTAIKDQDPPAQPHRLIIDLGAAIRLSGFRYTPRQGPDDVTGRIKTYRIYVGDRLAVAP
jgi:beta-galactosidase